MSSPDGFILIHHPRHGLWIGIHIRSRYVLVETNMFKNSPHVGARKIFKLSLGHFVWIAHNPSFASSERQINDRSFPGHPAGQGPYRINCFRRMEPYSAFGGSTRKIVLNAVTVKNLYFPIVHTNRHCEFVFPLGPQQQLCRCSIKIDNLRGLRNLFLFNLK